MFLFNANTWFVKLGGKSSGPDASFIPVCEETRVAN